MGLINFYLFFTFPTMQVNVDLNSALQDSRES